MDWKLGGLIAAAVLTGCSPAPAPPPPAPEAQSAPARPAHDTLAGFKLGAPAVIPECRKERRHGMVIYAFEDVGYPCWQDSSGAGGSLTSAPDLGKGPEHNGVGDIHLAAESVPAGVETTARVMMLDGRVEEVWLPTDGADSQERLYAMLVAKYGEPDSSNVTQLQNGFGAQFAGIDATWHFPAMRLRFAGVLGQRDTGAIIASTPAAQRFSQQRQPARANSF